MAASPFTVSMYLI